MLLEVQAISGTRSREHDMITHQASQTTLTCGRECGALQTQGSHPSQA